MTTIVERYDRDAELYDAHWQPVLDAAARRLLERVDDHVERAARTAARLPLVADIGTGTGALAVAACERWPMTRVVGIDPSAGMLGLARARAVRAGIGSDGERLLWLQAPAERLPLDDTSTDLAVSSFVLQLVEERVSVLGEIGRVLRPGGRLAFVTWLDRGDGFAPDVEFDEAFYDLEMEEDEPGPEPVRAGDYRSLRAVERELRGTGFTRVSVRADRLTWTWSREEYLAFKRDYDERSLFESLAPDVAEAFAARLLERWSALPDEAFTLRSDLVSAVCLRP